MADLEARKGQAREDIREMQEVLTDLLEERLGLDGRRAEAAEKDNAELSRLHREYVTEVEAGKNPKRPMAFFQHRAEVEARAQKIPTDIDRATLDLARAKLALVTLERSETLAAEKAPRERLERIKEEVSQLREEERQAEQEATNARKRTEAKQQEEFLLDQEVSGLEGALARTRVAANWGVAMG